MVDSYSSSALAESILHPPAYSRDPGGLLPVGIESMMGQDPVGTVVSEGAVSSLDHDDIIQSHQHPQRLPRPSSSTRLAIPPTPDVMALLVGIPPPPPPDNPPPLRRRRSKSTPRVSNSKSNRSSDELPMEVSFSASGGELGEESDQINVPSTDPLEKPLVLNPVVADLIRKAQNKYGDHQQHQQQQVNHKQYHRQVSAESNSVDPPEGGDHARNQVLPHHNQATPRLVLSSASASVGQENRSPESGKISLFPPQRSPISIATEPISNHHPGNRDASLVVTSNTFLNVNNDTVVVQLAGAATLASDGVEEGRDQHSHSSMTSDRIKGPRPKTPDRLRRVLGGAGGAMGSITGSQHRRNRSEEVERQSKERNYQQRQHRRNETIGARVEISNSNGFLKNNSRSKTPEGRHRSETPEVPGRSGSSYTHTISTGVTSGQKSVSSVSGHSGAKPSTTKGKNKSYDEKASKSNFFRKLFGGKKKKANKREKTEYDARTFESDHEKIALKDHMEQINQSRSSSEQTALEPPQFEDGAIVLEGYSKDGHDDDNDDCDRGSVFFAHDEVSTLTAPTMESYYRRRDPGEKERVSEPVGHYWNPSVIGTSVNRDDNGFPAIDPFTEPFFKEPAGASPTPNSSAADLRVQVPLANDPVGESPLNSLKAKPARPNHQHPLHDPSPRGNDSGPQLTDLPTQDPIGESPLHKHNRGPIALLDGTPYAPDPPLYLAALEVGTSSSSWTEEKGDEHLSGATPTQKENEHLPGDTPRHIPVRSSSPARTLPPPRPPSPAKGISKNSPRRPPLRITPTFSSDSSTFSTKVPSISTSIDTAPTPTHRSVQSLETDSSRTTKTSQKITSPLAKHSPPLVSLDQLRTRQVGSALSTGLADSDEGLDSPLASISNIASTDSEKPTSPSKSTKQPSISPSSSLSSYPTTELDLSATRAESPVSANLASPASIDESKEVTARTLIQKRAAARKGRSTTKLKMVEAAADTSPHLPLDGKASTFGGASTGGISVSSHRKGRRGDPKDITGSQIVIKSRKVKSLSIDANMISPTKAVKEANDQPEIIAPSRHKPRREDKKNNTIANQVASNSRKAASTAGHTTAETSSPTVACDSSSDGKSSNQAVKACNHDKSRRENPNNKSGNKDVSKTPSEPASEHGIPRTFSPRAALKAKARANKKNDDDTPPVQADQLAEVSVSPKIKTNLLTISSAARMNAKAVAYLHTLNGDPSPRHAWRRPQDSDDEPSPAGAAPTTFLSDKPVEEILEFNKKTKSDRDSKTNVVTKRGVNLKKETTFERDVNRKNGSVLELDDPRNVPSPSGAAVAGASRIFSAYSGKFKGRGLMKKPLLQHHASPRVSDPKETVKFKQPKVPTWKQKKPLGRDVTISAVAVSAGYNLFRKNRDDDVASGRSSRVVPIQKIKTPKVKSYFGPFEDPEPKDPIQRAGRRLLSRAAVPVQAAARRYLARREAVNRMWAILEIQSCARRWRAEAAFIASRTAAVSIQSFFRGCHCRAVIQSQQTAATQIQKIVRGYVDAIRVYEEVYRVILLQSKVRSMNCRRKFKSMHSSALRIQTQFRAFRARQLKKTTLSNIAKIQAIWRSYLIRTCFQFVVVDIIIAQSVIRRWLTRKRFLAALENKRNEAAKKLQSLYRGYQVRLMIDQNKAACLAQKVWRGFLQRAKFLQLRSAVKIQTAWRRFQCNSAFIAFKAARKVQTAWRLFRDFLAYKRYNAAKKIQCSWRGFQCYSIYKKHKAATQIQAIWRGFQGYTDYVFMLVDILVLQRSVRRWLAQKQVVRLRRERAAIVIQKNWRSHYAQHCLLVDLMRIILVQSVVRRYLSHGIVITRQHEHMDAQLAATKIQAAWRGFWNYSLYVILRYETVRIQTYFRSRLAQINYMTSLGCCILIQSQIRRYLAEARVRSVRAERSMLQGLAEGLREVNACKRIQFFWRVVMECRREKKAALVIERFFLMVKQEVDREILRAKEKKNSRRRRSTSTTHKKLLNEGDSLEHVWIDSMDESRVGVFTFSRSKSSDDSKSQKSDHSGHSRRSSSKSKLVAADPHDGVSTCFSQGSTGTSARETVYKSGVRHRASSPTLNLVMRHDNESKPMVSAHRGDRHRRKSLRKNLSLEANELTDSSTAAEKYMLMYGVRTAPFFSSKEHHFFNENNDTIEDCKSTTTPKSTRSGPKSNRSDTSAKKESGWRRLLSEDNKRIGEKANGSPHEPQDSNSPRHGKILIMNPYPEFQPPLQGLQQDSSLEETEYLSEDFGLI